MKEKKSKSGAYYAIGLMIANFLVKFMGLLREILLAQFYGTSIYTDAYITANNIPTVLFAAVGTSIATTFIPMYSKIKEEHDEERANTFSVHLIEALLFICLGITLLGEVFIDKVVFLFASGFQGEVLELTLIFARILFPSIFGLALMNVLGAYLQQHGKFIPIALVPLFGNGTIVIALIISHYLQNIGILVWGTLAGLIAQLFFYIPWVIKTGILNRKRVLFTEDTYFFRLLLVVFPVFIGEAVNEVNAIIDRTLVSGLPIGSVSALNYSYKVINLITGVFVASVGTVIFPKLSKYAAEKKMSELGNFGSAALEIVFYIMVAITVSVVVFRTEIVQFLFQRGNFDYHSVTVTSTVLACYSVGLAGIGMRDVLTKLFYSMQKIKVPMYNGIFCALINVVLDIILIHFLGICGAALATSSVAIIGAVNLIYRAAKHKLLDIKHMTNRIIKVLPGVVLLTVFDMALKALSDVFFAESLYGRIVLDGLSGVLGLVFYGYWLLKGGKLKFLKKA